MVDEFSGLFRRYWFTRAPLLTTKLILAARPWGRYPARVYDEYRGFDPLPVKNISNS